MSVQRTEGRSTAYESSRIRPGPAIRAAGRRLLPGSGRTVLHHAAGRSRRGRDQGGEPGRRRHQALDAASHQRRGVDLLPGHQPQQAVGRPGPEGSGRPGQRAGAGPPGRRDGGELQAGRPGQVRARLPVGPGRQRRHRVRLDQRLRLGRRQPPAGLRPDGAGYVRPDEPDGRSGRPAVPVRYLGLRRHRRPAHRDRHPGRAQPPGRYRPGPARRGQPAGLRDVRDGQPDQCLRGRRGGAAADGQRASEPVPL